MSQQQQQHSSSLKEDEEENSSSSLSHKKDATEPQKLPATTLASKYSLDAEDLENKNYVKSILFSSSSSPSTNNNNNNNVKSVAKTTKTSPINQFSQVSFNLSQSPHNNESLDKLTRSYMAKNALENISNIDEDLLVDKSFMFQGGNQEEEPENEKNDDDESKLVQEEEEEENLLFSKTNSPLNKITNREENLNEEDDDEDDFKLFARNENYKEKYITKSSQQQGLPPLPINNQLQKQQSNESRLDDSLYDVMSIGNQTPFKFDMLSSGGGGGGNGGDQFDDFTQGK